MMLKQVIHHKDNSVEATWVTRQKLPDVEVPATQALYDADGNEVQAAIPVHVREGEIVETVVRCHSYADVQMDMLRADLGDDGGQYEDLIARVEAAIVPPAPPAPPTPPQIVSRRQGRQALILAGRFAAVQSAIDVIEDETDRLLAQSWWDDSAEYERTNPFLLQLAQVIRLDDAALDALFVMAGGL